ncbi:dermokine isoform X8 [Pipistrellus kuhlii]|uniref:dermokine isoform X8 n=1 Tax=Pipistrellus kuhlii TaxID=59472 RepID=UPI001E26FB7F|nr:dermokine isoform X8 [Pipistrellus kuhlii]
MKLQGSLACLLLALYLGSGEAGPLLSGGASAETGFGEAAGQAVGDAINHGIREAIDQGAGEAAHALGNTGSEAGRQAENIIRHGIDAAHSSWQGMPGSNSAWGTNGQPPSGGHSTFGSQDGLRAQSQSIPEGPGNPWIHGVSGGSGGNFGTNSQGSSWGQGGNGGPYNVGTNAQGAVAQPGYGSVRGNNNPNTECTNSPPSGSGGSSSNSWGSSGGNSGGSSGGGSGSGGSGGSGSSGGNSNSGGSSSGGSSSGGSSSGDSSGGSSSGSSGSGGRGSGGSSSGSSSGGNWEHGSSSSSGSSGGSGGNKPGCDNPGNEVRVAGGSGAQGISKEGSRLIGNSQGNYQNSQTSPGLFNFDTFWKNFKSKLGFINWDAINKGQVPSPSTRALLYFSRLWEDFKHNTPFLNWKAIIEDDYSSSSLQKRAGSAGQPGAGWPEVEAVTSKNYNYNQQAYPPVSGGQYSAKVPSKGGATLSSSASRAQPGLLQWVKFW